MKAWISESNLRKGESTTSRPSPITAAIAVVIFFLIAASVIAALMVRSNSESTSQRNLDDAAEVAIDSINIELTEGISQLNGIQGLFNASNFVTREEFDKFVAGFLAEPHGIQALEWIPRIPASQKEQYINSVRQEGFEGFTIRPETQSQDFFPVTYVAPFSGNTAALGFDLYSEEVRRAALMKAWETGELAITDPIILVQETGSQLAFLAYAPVYSSKDIPSTLQERRDLLVGFGLGVIRFGDFINHALPASFDPNIGIIVVDVDDHPNHENVYYTNLEPIERTLDVQGLQTVRSLRVADREWIFHFTGPQNYGLGGFERASWILVLVIGLLLSAIILAIALLLYRGRKAALELAIDRQQSEEAQRALAMELTLLIDTANNPIFGVDIDGRINIWNDVMQVITGASRKEAIGQLAVDYMTADSTLIAQSHLQSVLSDIPCGDLYLKFSGPAGDSSELLINCTIRRDATGEISGVLGVGLDITERLRAEQEIKELNESLEIRVTARTRELQEALARSAAQHQRV